MRNSRDPDVHLNINVRGLRPSATLAINERSRRLLREGRQVFKLGLGQSPFPVPQPVVEELRANAHQKDYLPVEGLPELRDAVAEHHRRTQGVPLGGEHVIIGPGSKELMFLLQLVYYGDLVIPTPCWVSYAPQANIIGRPIAPLHTRREAAWQLTPEQLARLCAREPDRPRLVILNYPNNPTGGSYTLEALKELAAAARRYRVILLSDEIYGGLHHRGQHVSIARFYPEGTIISSGLSKWCGAGGWRLGAFAFPPSLRWLMDAMAAVASETYTATSAPIQYAAVRAFQGGEELEHYLTHCRRILRHLGRWIAQRLRQDGVHVENPVGAFYLFPDFGPLQERLAQRGIDGPETLCERLLEETGVAILPGTAFGRPDQELTCRLAYVDFDGARALETSRTSYRERSIDAAFLQTCCGGVLEASERLCAWLQSPSP